MTLAVAVSLALRVIYQHEKSDGELQSVYVADFASETGEGVRESVRGYLQDCDGGLCFDFESGLESLKNQVWLNFYENGRLVSNAGLKAYHYTSDKWKVFAQVAKTKEF